MAIDRPCSGWVLLDSLRVLDNGSQLDILNPIDGFVSNLCFTKHGDNLLSDGNALANQSWGFRSFDRPDPASLSGSKDLFIPNHDLCIAQTIPLLNACLSEHPNNYLQFERFPDLHTKHNLKIDFARSSAEMIYFWASHRPSNALGWISCREHCISSGWWAQCKTISPVCWVVAIYGWQMMSNRLDWIDSFLSCRQIVTFFGLRLRANLHTFAGVLLSLCPCQTNGFSFWPTLFDDLRLVPISGAPDAHEASVHNTLSTTGQIRPLAWSEMQ